MSLVAENQRFFRDKRKSFGRMPPDLPRTENLSYSESKFFSLFKVLVCEDLSPIKCRYYCRIEHSENRIIKSFGNEIGPEVLQSSIQQTYSLQKFHATQTVSTHNQLYVVCAFGILAALVFMERWTGALQVRSRFQTSHIAL